MDPVLVSSADAEVVSQCVMGTAAACQRIIGDLLATGVPVDPAGFTEYFDGVPEPATYSDAAMAAFVLLRFVQDLGTVVHRRLHVAGAACGFDPEAFVPPVHVDPSAPSRWHPALAFSRWASRYLSALGQTHDLKIARVQLQMTQNPGQRHRLAAMARDVATSIPVMRRRFVSLTGETPVKYRTRLRIIEAIRLIRQGWKRQAVAAAVGWKSPKDLYRALATVAKTSPSQLQSMSEADVGALLARLGLAAAVAESDKPGGVQKTGGNRTSSLTPCESSGDARRRLSGISTKH